jgi:hypothetical protein
MRFAGVQRQHGVVVQARFLDVWQLRQQKAEIHDSSLRAMGLTRSRKPADMEVGCTMGAVTNVYSFPSGKGERHMGQLSLSGMAAPYRR